MKKLHYIFLLNVVVSITSCSKDLGNYEYQDVNEVSIAGLNNSYNVRTGIDTLRLRPTLAASMDDANPSRYEHRWILRLDPKTLDTIGREQNLDYPVRLGPGTMSLYYRVRDTKTGVTSLSPTITLNINTANSKGLLLMGEDEAGFAEAEMLSMINDTVHIKSILSSTTLPKLREPVSFVYTGPSGAQNLWALTRTGSYYLDRATMTATSSNNFRSRLFTSENLNPETLHPVVFAPQIRTASGTFSSSFYNATITAGGDLFAGSPFINGEYFVNPVNRVATNQQERLTAAPYLLYAIGNMNAVMWYDTKYNRFLNHSNFAGVASAIPAENGSQFPWDQSSVGRTLVYAENTRNTDGGSTNGNSFAIMKDASNKHHIYKFYVNGSNPAKRAYYEVKPIATDFDKADHYAFSSKRTVIFYAVSNRLYAYDYNPGNEKVHEINIFDGDEITMLKFDTQIDHLTNSLYIGTYNSTTKGTLRRFNVGSNPDVVTLEPIENASWSGLIKVRDVNWRAVN